MVSSSLWRSPRSEGRERSDLSRGRILKCQNFAIGIESQIEQRSFRTKTFDDGSIYKMLECLVMQKVVYFNSLDIYPQSLSRMFGTRSLARSSIASKKLRLKYCFENREMAISQSRRKSILVWQLLPLARSCWIRKMTRDRSSTLTVNLRMTSSVLAAATLHGNVLVFWILLNSSGMNFCMMVVGLMQLAKQENFSKQSAWSRQFLVKLIFSSQLSSARLRS